MGIQIQYTRCPGHSTVTMGIQIQQTKSPINGSFVNDLQYNYLAIAHETN